MPRYLYHYINLLGVLGHGTPESPGSDFSMSVWIEAPDEDAAQRWGKVVLDDYVRARFQLSHGAGAITSWGEEGRIEQPDQALEGGRNLDYPVCQVGELPAWSERWKIHNGRKRSGD